MADGPQFNVAEWAESIAAGSSPGTWSCRSRTGPLSPSSGPRAPRWSTGRRLVLFVALTTSRWGARFRRAAQGTAPRALTAREREIVELVSLGGAGPEIADELHISHETVRTHVRNAMEKLDARSRAHLVAKALAEGHLVT